MKEEQKMERVYQGYDERKGTWEQFEWNETEDPTPESTGYDKVEEVDINNDLQVNK